MHINIIKHNINMQNNLETIEENRNLSESEKLNRLKKQKEVLGMMVGDLIV